MANFTAADVKRLREQTGAGMMDCKNALEEAEGVPEISAESAITSDADAAADEADDLAGLQDAADAADAPVAADENE